MGKLAICGCVVKNYQLRNNTSLPKEKVSTTIRQIAKWDCNFKFLQSQNCLGCKNHQSCQSHRGKFSILHNVYGHSLNQTEEIGAITWLVSCA